MSNFSDEKIITKVLDGDIDIFKILVQRYQDKVYSIGIRFFKNSDDAMDFTQEIFVKVFEKLNTFKGESPFKYWLSRIAYNYGITKIKKIKDEIEYEDFYFSENYNGPEDDQIKKEVNELLLNAIKKLPEKYKVCMDLYFFWDMNFKKISEITGFPINTIKSNVFRAKQILRDELRGTTAEEYNE